MRRTLLLPFLLASTLGLAACGQAADTTSDGDTAVPVAAPTTAAPTTAAPIADEPATEAPSEDEAPGTERNAPVAGGDCSASGMTAAPVTGSDLPEATRATAEFLVDAAVRCDEQLLTTAATESGTTLSFADVDPTTFFGLPETEDELYATIVTLLSEVPQAAQAHTDPVAHVWPRVATEAFADDDAAWQEVVDAGLLEADEATRMREAGAGYLGWRIGITTTGGWAFLVAGD